MENQGFKLTAGNEELSGAIYSAQDKSPNFVFMHGAGKGGKFRIFPYLEFLMQKGLSVLAFDFSGHGDSTGKLNESSLEKRMNEARSVIDKYADQKNLTLSGSSMGGYIALKLLDFYDVKNLILFCPAIYDRKALKAQFDEKFTNIIREENSWQNTDIAESLNKFKGNLLIVIGQKDNIIPKNVIDFIYDNATSSNKKEVLWIKDAPHDVHTWLSDHPDEMKQVINKIVEFTNS
jgi:esterase/lipase